MSIPHSPPPKMNSILSVEMEIGNLNQFNMAIHFLLWFWFISILFDLSLASAFASSFSKPSSLLVFMASFFQDPFFAACAAFVMLLACFLLWVFPRLCSHTCFALRFSDTCSLRELAFHCYLGLQVTAVCVFSNGRSEFWAVNLTNLL